MQFDYESSTLGDVIKGYYIREGKLVVTYFKDGETYKEYITYSKEKEREILDLMLKQAEERNRTSLKHNTYLVANTSAINTAITAGITAIAAANNSVNKNPLNYGIMAVAGLSALKAGLDYAKERAKLNELKKYAIYLRMRPLLDATNLTRTFEGDIAPETLNINTLDNYSLKEIEKIESNVEGQTQEEILSRK